MFARKTVAGVLASFSKTVDDLRQIAFIEENRAVEKRIAALDLEIEANAADAESRRADAIADKLSALIS